ncbi:MAG: methionine--tRNA ligase, partial [Candidatus Nanohaloarchaea archaeon]|nr:methionine--tRNA ligase [Candidatus Nanohaloarchaea archaeon]
GQALGDRDILFEKMDADALAAEIDDGGVDGESADGESGAPAGTVTVDEFGEFDLRVGTIVDAADHPNADRLYVLQVDVGGETLQTCSGLVEHYTAEELQGRQVVVLANLEPAELRGEQSECMVLAADDGDDVVLVGLQDAVADGAEVR